MTALTGRYSVKGMNERYMASGGFTKEDINAYREYLNETCSDKDSYQGDNKNRHSRTKPYGDYLYSQDRELFLSGVMDWMRTK